MLIPIAQHYYWFTNLLISFSGISFLIFGFSCLFSDFMRFEFKRYRLQNFRIFVGILQLLGAFGLFYGFFSKNWAVLASLGLALLMTFGFMVRLKIKDSFILAFPSLFYAVLNFLLFVILIKFET